MTLGTFLVLVGTLLAIVAFFADNFAGRVRSYVLPAAVTLIGLGVLVGAAPLIKG